MKSFFDHLREELDGYEGPYADLLRWTPKLIEYFGSLIEDTRLPRPARGVINAALAYFVLPFDVVPESSMGGFGYVDDLYLCAYAAHLLQCEPGYAELLDEHWGYDQPLGAIVGEILAAAEKMLPPEDRAQVLFFSGLSDSGAPER